MSNLTGFSNHFAETPEGRIAYSKAGAGSPVLLLHGFPQNRAMWHSIAPALAERHTVIAPDLRGYGDSFKPDTVAEMSFRSMAQDQLELMKSLGFEKFHLVGHDRGARTSHRLALDAPDAVLSLTLMDIVPTHLLLSELTHQVARAYYHWFFLAQPYPGPERMIGADADAFFESCLAGWGGDGMAAFDGTVLDHYRSAWRKPDTIRCMCHDYRAGIKIDFDHDAADLDRRVTCPSLVLFGADGVMARQYDVPATWKDRLTHMRAIAMPGGHFFPDTHPAETTAALKDFLQSV